MAKDKKKSWWTTPNPKLAKWALAIIAVLIVIVVVASCSGGSSDEETTVSKVTEEQTENGTIIPINESTTFGDDLYKITLDDVNFIKDDQIEFTFTVSNDSEKAWKITDILGWDGYQEIPQEGGGYETFSINQQSDNSYHNANLKLLDETVDPHSSKTVTLKSTLLDDTEPVYIEFYSDGDSGLSSEGDEWVTVEIDLHNGTFTTDRMPFF